MSSLLDSLHCLWSSGWKVIPQSEPRSNLNSGINGLGGPEHLTVYQWKKHAHKHIHIPLCSWYNTSHKVATKMNEELENRENLKSTWHVKSPIWLFKNHSPLEMFRWDQVRSANNWVFDLCNQSMSYCDKVKRVLDLEMLDRGWNVYTILKHSRWPSASHSLT